MSEIPIGTQFACVSHSDRQALQAYALYLVRKNAPKTRVRKLEQLRLFLLQASLPRPIQLAAITPDHIDAFILQAQRRGYAPGTINGYLHSIKDCFHFLQEEGYLSQTPVRPHRHYLPIPMRLPRPMARDDVRRLLAAVHSVRERAIFLVALCCGLRVSEVAHLRLADLDWERHTLRINQSKAGVDRLVYLTAEVEVSLRTWLRERVSCNDYLFCSQKSRSRLEQPMSAAHLHRLLQRSLQEAGIDRRKYTFHTLRHTFATELLNAGISLRSLQELLGHKSLQQVLIYAQLYDSTKRREFYQAMAAVQALPQPAEGE